MHIYTGAETNRFLEKFHPCFPILDEKRLIEAPKSCSPTLICGIYAIALLFWNEADFTANRARPDSQFAWNLAVTSLQEDLAPGLSKLQAVLIDLTGRPIYSLTGNVINNGRCVNLAYSLGLNRDPTQWELSEEDKYLRIRLWWGILIHDTWYISYPFSSSRVMG